jgi:hypothetical protein
LVRTGPWFPTSNKFSLENQEERENEVIDLLEGKHIHLSFPFVTIKIRTFPLKSISIILTLPLSVFFNNKMRTHNSNSKILWFFIKIF